MPNYRNIDTEQLSAWIDDKRNFSLIDVLPADYYEAKHLPTARNACVYEMTFLSQIESIIHDKEKPIVVYSASEDCRASRVAAERLSEDGYTNVYEYPGGVKEWDKAGFEFEGNDSSRWKDGPSLTTTSAVFDVDPERSQIHWTGRNINGSHTGLLTVSDGQMVIENGSIISGRFTIDMNSMTCRDLTDATYNKMLIDHLKSDDFFCVDKYPHVTFNVTKADPVQESSPGSANFTVSGDLTVRGIDNHIEFPAILTVKADDGSLCLQAYFDFDRTRWNVLYGSGKYFEKLGMHLVYDAIGIQLQVTATKNTA